MADGVFFWSREELFGLLGRGFLFVFVFVLILWILFVLGIGLFAGLLVGWPLVVGLGDWSAGLCRGSCWFCGGSWLGLGTGCCRFGCRSCSGFRRWGGFWFACGRS